MNFCAKLLIEIGSFSIPLSFIDYIYHQNGKIYFSGSHGVFILLDGKVFENPRKEVKEITDRLNLITQLEHEYLHDSKTGSALIANSIKSLQKMIDNYLEVDQEPETPTKSKQIETTLQYNYTDIWNTWMNFQRDVIIPGVVFEKPTVTNKYPIKPECRKALYQHLTDFVSNYDSILFRGKLSNTYVMIKKSKDPRKPFTFSKVDKVVFPYQHNIPDKMSLVLNFEYF